MAGSTRFTSEITNGCEKNADCVLGIRLDQCCSCAQTFSKSEVEANVTITAFEEGKDYSAQKMLDCSAVVCEPCPTTPSGVVCISNRCQIGE
ncbi:hypothetical protein GTO10_00805 [Candidatus Saccharibacteria bacterium]|nr:hypothetical protein [Candidatus Saccharibacteria bacterium]